MTKVEELRDRVLGNYPKIATNKKGIARILEIIESVDALIAAVEEAHMEREIELHEDKELNFGKKSLPVSYGDALPVVKAEEEKFYLNTDHIAVISTKTPKEPPCKS